VLPLVNCEVQSRNLNNPLRVKVPDFTITLSPGDPDLTALEAQEVRDIAESLFENYLQSYAWGVSTLYDYAGLSGVEEVTFDDSTSPSVSVIKVRGGLVVFQTESSVAPSEDAIEEMLQKALHPTSPSAASLTDVLKVTDAFGYVETSIYEEFLYPLPLPSQAPSYSSMAPSRTPSTAPSTSPSMQPSRTPSLPPSQVPSIMPSPAPSFRKDVSKLEETNTATAADDKSTFGGATLIGTAAAGVAVAAAIAAMLLLRRKGRKSQVENWKLGVQHTFPLDDGGVDGLHKRDSLQDRGGGLSADGRSEAGSSMLGRLLVAAALPTPRSIMRVTDSPHTTPQCSSNSEGSVDDFGSTTIIPSILKLSSLEDFEVDRHINVTTVEQQQSVQNGGSIRSRGADQSMPLEWQRTPHIAMPYRSSMTAAEKASTLHFEKWSDCSSGQADDDDTRVQSDAEGNFASDDVWDFQDNEDDDDESTVSPFHTPGGTAYSGFNDSKKILLDKAVERSSTISPSTTNNCFSV
jgi:hypothetical protein